MAKFRLIFRIEFFPFDRLDAYGRHFVLRTFGAFIRARRKQRVDGRSRKVKAGEEMPRQDTPASHCGKERGATGTHQPDDRSILQLQPLHIRRMHLEHVRIHHF